MSFFSFTCIINFENILDILYLHYLCTIVCVLKGEKGVHTAHTCRLYSFDKKLKFSLSKSFHIFHFLVFLLLCIWHEIVWLQNELFVYNFCYFCFIGVHVGIVSVKILVMCTPPLLSVFMKCNNILTTMQMHIVRHWVT